LYLTLEILMEKAKTYRVFGRTRGRQNRNISQEEYLNLILPYKVDKIVDKKKYILDIGSGYGETSIYLALKYKKYKIISCDKYINGNLNLIKNIKHNNLNNINIHNGNVYDILDKNKNMEYLSSVSIFFPDPWPKKKHFKRRLISNSFFKKIHPNIYKNGKIFIVTDSASYIKQIIKSIYDSRHIFKFINQSQLYLSVKDYFDIETKFYKKAIISGRKPVIFILQKL
tara:strand:- start:5770 stop:6450 length:681 start_codon:yes stop_codon:yes gene_type:complete